MVKNIGCPLCDSQDVQLVSLGQEFWGMSYYCECLKCGCRTSNHHTEEDAIEAWSTRPRESQLQGALDEAHRTIDGLREALFGGSNL